MSDPTLRLPFDQYQRYRLVADILNDLREDGERLSVLDVGGRTELLRKFLPDDEVFLVDVEGSDAEGLVLGDGSRLPYRDGAVDAVVCFDTLEHVPPPRRDDFLDEVLRVARRWAVVAGPYDTEGVAEAEQLLEDFLHTKMEVEHRYLAEHKQNGLPSYEGSIARLRAGGAEVASIAHANLQRWLALMCAELYMDRDPQLRALAARYYEFYNATLYASDHSAPVYRHALVAAKGGAPLPDASRLLGPPSAPAGVFEPVRALLDQLVDYDVEREVVQAEWGRLEGVNADLLLDLEGHRETLALLREENEVQRDVIRDLRERAIEILGNEDLLAAEVEEQSAELEKRAKEIERERLESERQAAELRGDLEARKRAVDELDALLERERHESRAVAQSLTVDLEAHREFVARLKQREEALEGRIAELDEQVGQHEARGGELERALASRDEALREQEQRLAEFERVVAGRDEAIRQHEAHAQELERIRGEQAAHAEELRAVIDELRAGIEQLTSEVRSRDEQLASLSARLDASELAREEQRAAFDAERAEFTQSLEASEAAREAQRVASEAQQEELVARLHEANVALGEKQGSLDRVRSELTHQRQVIEGLQRALGDRWGSLLRALGLK